MTDKGCTEYLPHSWWWQ